MLRAWLRRWKAWLRALILRRVAGVVPFPAAEDACAHGHDAQAVLHRLLLAVNNPQRFAAELAVFANCRGCATAVLVQCVYELAGLLLREADAEDQPAEEATCDCDCPVCPEAVAMRLALAYDSDDPDTLAMTLGQILDCRACMLAVILALTRAHVTVLDDTKLAWRPMLERHLLTILDGLGS